MTGARRALLLPALALATLWALAGAPGAAAAPWCGTTSTADRPATVAGHQIRVVYATAANGADRSAEWAPRISADVDQIETWWQSQDSSRTPRFDRASFPCGAQADIRLLVLPVEEAALLDGASTFGAVEAAAATLGGSPDDVKVLVYLDVPAADAGLCGQGGGSFTGAGLAIVYVRACAGIPAAPVAAHELLHAFGALPASGPPHACPGDDGHPCDSSGDILYPYAQPADLSAFALDVGRDDYYAHGGTWVDMRDSKWLRHLDAQVPVVLVVRGGGSVASAVPGIACGASCTTSWDDGSALALTATPAAGQRFVRWGGACTGGGPCFATLSGATSVTALFAPPTYRLSVSVSGRGRVVAARVSCPARCAAPEPSYAALEVRALAAAGWRFARWSGACAGQRPRCRVPMSADTVARALFVRR